MSWFSEKSKFEQLKAEKNKEIIAAKRKKLIIRLIVIAAVVIGAYITVSICFRFYFYPHTVINGVNCSMKNVSNSSELLRERVEGYELTLYEKGDQTEVITGSEIDLEITPEETLEELLDEQTGFGWIRHLFPSGEEFVFEDTVVFDEEKFEQAVDGLECLQEENIIYPAGPELSDYVEGVGYEIISPVYGNVVNRDALVENLKYAFESLSSRLDMEVMGCYETADFSAELARLGKLQDILNPIVNTTITYEFGDEQEVLDGTLISQWLVIEEETPDGEDTYEDDDEYNAAETVTLTVEDLANDKSGNIDLDSLSIHVDRDRLAEFVYDLAYKYNTLHQYHTLNAHSGESVTVDGGNYGWQINQTATLDELAEHLAACEDYTGEVIFTHRAAHFGFPDYGDTYIEVSLDEQHFWYYRDGELTLESDLVSGNPSTGHATPTGIYEIAYKARDQVLTGENYSSPVSYWMPFYSGVGFHDASWRSSFGGTIYKYGGSHGCLNLPYSVAEQLYGYIEGGEAVLIY